MAKNVEDTGCLLSLQVCDASGSNWVKVKVNAIVVVKVVLAEKI